MSIFYFTLIILLIATQLNLRMQNIIMIFFNSIIELKKTSLKLIREVFLS